MNTALLATLAHLSTQERVWLSSSARQAQRLETTWKNRFDAYLRTLDAEVFKSLVEHGRVDAGSVDFLPLVLEHSYRVMSESFATAQHGLQVGGFDLKMAAPRDRSIPRNLKDLKILWDSWQRKKNIPQRQKRTAEKIRKAYLDRVQSVWDKHGEDFREGKEYNADKVRDVLSTQGDMARSRVNTVVQTETTYYYNRARRTLYDQSPDVTHYLFVAIRDQATTKWCKSRQGIVYKKGDPLLDDETPPIHWNCRSEILPLTMQNPRHLKLIQDKSRDRRHHHCEPLPSGWKRRAA